MICRKCADAAATYHLTESRNDGSSFELHLCDRCAEGLGMTGTLGPSISGLLESLGAGPDASGKGAFLVSPLLCGRCKKGHASIHLFEAVRGGEREQHLCELCGGTAADELDSVFTDFPDFDAAPPRPLCPECGQVRFDYVKVGTQIRGSIQFAVLPIRILVRGCAWSPP